MLAHRAPAAAAFGVAKAKKLMLDSPILAERVRLLHLDTSDIRGLANMGRFDWRNALLGVKHAFRLVRAARQRAPGHHHAHGVSRETRPSARRALCTPRPALPVQGRRPPARKQVREPAGDRGTWRSARTASHPQTSSLVIVLGNSLIDMAKAVYPPCRVAVIPNGCPPAVKPELVGTRDEYSTLCSPT